MRNLAIALLALNLASCAAVRERLNPPVAPQPPPKAATVALKPVQNLSDLVKHRLYLCQQERNVRADQLKQIRAKMLKTRRSARGNSLPLNDKLAGLMLTTCDLASTPTLFTEMMQVVTNEGNWPDDYEAFFELLKSQHRSFIQVQNYAQDLDKELSVTKVKLDTLQDDYQKTIKSIGDIEENLDSRKTKPATAQ